MRLDSKKSENMRSLFSFSRKLAAALKVFALSVIIIVGVPLLAQKRHKLQINVDVVKSFVSSRCIALVTFQVNKVI